MNGWIGLLGRILSYKQYAGGDITRINATHSNASINIHLDKVDIREQGLSLQEVFFILRLDYIICWRIMTYDILKPFTIIFNNNNIYYLRCQLHITMFYDTSQAILYEA